MPDGPALVFALFVVGFLLVAAEVFLPGLILGILGFICLIASVVLVFVHYGTSAGFVAALAVGVFGVAGFFLWLFVFPRTFLGRRIMLRTAPPPARPAADHRDLIGETGEALTPLRPSGTARIGGRRMDVTAVGEFLECGAAVEVVAADGLRVAVRAKDGLEPAAPPL